MRLAREQPHRVLRGWQRRPCQPPLMARLRLAQVLRLVALATRVSLATVRQVPPLCPRHLMRPIGEPECPFQSGAT